MASRDGTVFFVHYLVFVSRDTHTHTYTQNPNLTLSYPRTLSFQLSLFASPPTLFASKPMTWTCGTIARAKLKSTTMVPGEESVEKTGQWRMQQWRAGRWGSIKQFAQPKQGNLLRLVIIQLPILPTSGAQERNLV